MKPSLHHLQTNILKRSQQSADRAEGYQFKTDIAILEAEAPVLNVIFTSFIREGNKCLSLETKSSFEAETPEMVKVIRHIEEEEARKEYARVLVHAQVEHLKLLSRELPAQNISILCLEFNSAHHFERLLMKRMIKFG